MNRKQDSNRQYVQLDRPLGNKLVNLFHLIKNQQQSSKNKQLTKKKNNKIKNKNKKQKKKKKK